MNLNSGGFGPFYIFMNQEETLGDVVDNIFSAILFPEIRPPYDAVGNGLVWADYGRLAIRDLVSTEWVFWDWAEARFKNLLRSLIKDSPLLHSSIHGWRHWVSVYRNALLIAHYAGLLTPPEDQPPFNYITCALLFSLFHDCRRQTEGRDLSHGVYGGVALWSCIRSGVRKEPTPEQIVAAFACSGHTVIDYPSEDGALKTITDRAGLYQVEESGQIIRNALGLCLDADRLHLLRLGMTLEGRYLTHKEAVRLAARDLLGEVGAK